CGDIGVPATPFLMMLNVCASDTPMSRRSPDTIGGPLVPPPPPAPWQVVHCWLYRVSPSATASILPRNGLAGPGGALRCASSVATAHRSSPATERAAFMRGLASYRPSNKPKANTLVPDAIAKNCSPSTL